MRIPRPPRHKRHRAERPIRHPVSLRDSSRAAIRPRRRDAAIPIRPRVAIVRSNTQLTAVCADRTTPPSSESPASGVPCSAAPGTHTAVLSKDDRRRLALRTAAATHNAKQTRSAHRLCQELQQPVETRLLTLLAHAEGTYTKATLEDAIDAIQCLRDEVRR